MSRFDESNEKLAKIYMECVNSKISSVIAEQTSDFEVNSNLVKNLSEWVQYIQRTNNEKNEPIYKIMIDMVNDFIKNSHSEEEQKEKIKKIFTTLLSFNEKYPKCKSYIKKSLDYFIQYLPDYRTPHLSTGRDRYDERGRLIIPPTPHSQRNIGREIYDELKKEYPEAFQLKYIL